jgi:hypothetical protein
MAGPGVKRKAEKNARRSGITQTSDPGTSAGNRDPIGEDIAILAGGKGVFEEIGVKLAGGSRPRQAHHPEQGQYFHTDASHPCALKPAGHTWALEIGTSVVARRAADLAARRIVVIP